MIVSVLVMAFTRGGIFLCILLSSHLANPSDFAIFTSMYWVSTSLGQVIGYHLITNSVAMQTTDDPGDIYNYNYVKRIILHALKSISVFSAVCILSSYNDPFNLIESRYSNYQVILILLWSIAIALESLSIYLANSLNLVKSLLYASIIQSLALSLSPAIYLVFNDLWIAVVVSVSFLSSFAFLIVALKKAPNIKCLTGRPRKLSRGPTYGAMNILTVLMGSCLTIIFTQRFVADGSRALLSIAEFTVVLQIVSALSFVPQILNNEMVRRIHRSQDNAERLNLLVNSCIAVTVFVAVVSIPLIALSGSIFNIYGIEVTHSSQLALFAILTVLFQAFSLATSTYFIIKMNSLAIFSATSLAFFCSISFFFIHFSGSASHILLCLILFHCVRSAGLAAYLLHKSFNVFDLCLKER